jgi:hypothetical protein
MRWPSPSSGTNGGRWIPVVVAAGLAGLFWGVKDWVADLAWQAGTGTGVTEGGPGGVRLLTGVDVWLLSVFTAGVIVLLLASSAWIAERFGSRGARDVLLGTPSGSGPGGARWMGTLGGSLLLIYALGWLAFG